jgi:hypothetical protein
MTDFKKLKLAWDTLGIWFILLTISTLVDYVATAVLLQHGNMELNPILNWLLNRFGVSAILVVKLTVLCCITFLNKFIVEKESRFINRWIRSIKVCAIIQTLIAVWGVFLILGGL